MEMNPMIVISCNYKEKSIFWFRSVILAIELEQKLISSHRTLVPVIIILKNLHPFLH